MNKQTVVHPYSEILFSNKIKKQTKQKQTKNADTDMDTDIWCNNMDKSQMHFANCKKIQIKRL